MSAPQPIGIDFGTTKTLVCRWDERRQQPVEIRLGRLGPMPTSIHVDTAGNYLFGDDADDNQVSDPAGYVSRVKRYLGRKAPLVPHGKIHAPVSLVSEFLRHVRSRIEEEALHGPVGHTVITVPALFGPAAKTSLKQAVESAGFTDFELLDEPVAGGRAFLRDSPENVPGQNFLVFDWGGGTLDLAVVRREDEKLIEVSDLLGGDMELGGEDIDDSIVEGVSAMLKAGGRPGLEEQSEKHFADARRALIAGKELLSRKQSHTFRFELGDGPLEFTWRAEQFEEFIASPVERAVSQVKRLVEKAMAASVTLDGIILIGGSSKIPMVERRIDEVTGIKILKYDHSQEAVARGAALIAHARVSQTVAAIAVGHAEQSDLAQIPQWVVQTAAHPVAQIPKSAVALIPRPVSLPPARIGVLITTLVVVLLAVGSAGWWFGIEEPRRDRKTTALRLMEDQERATKERQDLAAAQAQLEAERERKAKINDELKNARSALGIKAVQLLHEAAQKGELPPQVVVDALQHADTLTAEQVQDLCARERTRRAEETLRSIAPAARPPQRDAVTLTKSVAVLLPSGQVNLPAGTILRYFGTEGPNARVSWNNNDFFVPANTTDIYDSPAAPASPGAQEMASSHASSPLAKPLEDLRTAGKPREFKAGDLVEITRAAPLSYNGKTYRDAAIGDRFKVLAYRPVEKRVYLVLRGSDGQDIAVAVEDDAVTVVPLPERAIAAARLGQIKEAAVLIQAAINTAPGNMELAEIQRTVLAVAKATEDMASANQQRAFAMREATNLEHGAAAIDRPNALFPKDTSNQMHAEVMRRQAQRLLDESETALRTAKENYDAKIAALRDLKGTSTRTTDAARTPAMLGASPSGGIPGLDPTPGAASPAGDRF